MLIALTGFMGSGKSTVGRSLADMLGCPFLELDAMVEKAAGRSITAIFAEGGESAFRSLEAAALKKALSKYSQSDAVLACGGGTDLSALKGATCIWLRAGVDELAERLSSETASRPLLKDAEDLRGRISELLTAREATYEAAADVILDTDGHSPEEIAQEIIITAL